MKPTPADKLRMVQSLESVNNDRNVRLKKETPLVHNLQRSIVVEQRRADDDQIAKAFSDYYLHDQSSAPEGVQVARAYSNYTSVQPGRKETIYRPSSEGKKSKAPQPPSNYRPVSDTYVYQQANDSHLLELSGSTVALNTQPNAPSKNFILRQSSAPVKRTQSAYVRGERPQYNIRKTSNGAVVATPQPPMAVQHKVAGTGEGEVLYAVPAKTKKGTLERLAEVNETPESESPKKATAKVQPTKTDTPKIIDSGKEKPKDGTTTTDYGYSSLQSNPIEKLNDKKSKEETISLAGTLSDKGGIVAFAHYFL